MAATALENLVGDMTLSELSEKSGRSVEQIVNFAIGSKPAASNGAQTRTAKTVAARSTSSVNTRTRQGRAEYDAKILAALRQLGEAKAADLEAVGGDEFQRRASLHRLIEAKKVKREGVARATVYKAK